MHERGVHGVKAGFVVNAGEAPAEANDAEVRRQEQLDVVAVLDVALRCQCEVERAVDRGAERIETEVSDRGPYLERAGHPAELQAEVREVHLAGGDHRVLQIVGGHLERAAQTHAIAHQHRTALEWLVQPFVRIERHGVGMLDAGQGRTPAFGERGETAVRGVNVHPHPVLGADSAIDASGSTLPLLVAPAAADTKMGRRPSATSAWIAPTSASVRMA